METHDSKRCSVCGAVKPLDAFSRQQGRPKAACKPCTTARQKGYSAKVAGKIAAYQVAYAARNREKLRAYKADYHRRNRDTHREQGRAYRERNPGRVAEAAAAWRERNPERVLVYRKRYYSKNQSKYRAETHRYRARLRNAAINDFTDAQWQELVAYYGGHCAYCGERCESLTRDHMMPVSRGGDNTLANIAPACLRCNQRKNARSLMFYLMA